MSRDQNPELPEFPDLASRAAEGLSPPAFDDLLDRSRRRTNRRRAVAGAVAAVVVVAGLGTALGLDRGQHDATPTHKPTDTPSVSPSPQPDVADILREGALTSITGRDGDVLVVRTLCNKQGAHCASAWRLTTAKGTFTGSAPGNNPGAYAAGEDFLVGAWNKLGIVVHPDGTTTALHKVGRLGSAPDGFVPGRDGWLAVDTTTGAAGSLPPIGDVADIAQAAVTNDGTVVAMPQTSGPARVSIATYRDGAWSTQRVSDGNLPGYVVPGGDHVAVLASTDGATISPVATLAVSANGHDWTMLHKADLPFDAVEAMAATDTGALYVGTPQGLFRSTDDSWTHFTRASPGSAPLIGSIGDQVVVKTGSDSYAGLDADGHSTDLGDLR